MVIIARITDKPSLCLCLQDCFTPLYMAAQIGHQEIVTLLLANGADPILQTKVAYSL